MQHRHVHAAAPQIPAASTSSIIPPASRRALSPSKKRRSRAPLLVRECLPQKQKWKQKQKRAVSLTLAIFLLGLGLILLKIGQYISGIKSGKNPPNVRDTTITIPKASILKEGALQLTQLPFFLRFLDSPKIRKTGNQALVNYAQEIRNILSFGKSYIMNINTLQKQREDMNNQETKSYEYRNKQLFQQRLAKMAPWLVRPLSQFPEPKFGKAILICAGDKQIEYLEALLYTIREIHKSTNIAIYVSYRGDDDLSPINRSNIQSKFNLTFLELSKHFDLATAGLRSWNLRPYGALLVPETEILMLDADVLLFRPPEDLFQLQGYQATGALFFHDRMQAEWLWTPKHFFLRLQPHPSSQLTDTLSVSVTNDNDNIQKIYQEHVMESGVLLLDKSRRALGLWAACLLLGRPDIRRFAQTNYIYGDKEMYIAAMEMIQEPYALSRYYPGVIGNVFTDFQTRPSEIELDADSEKLTEMIAGSMSLCGRLLHFDDSGTPLWSNGGYITKEDDFSANSESISTRGLRPLYFMDGGDSWTEQHRRGPDQKWTYNSNMGVNCLFPNARNIRNVPPDVAQHGSDAVAYFLKLKTKAN